MFVLGDRDVIFGAAVLTTMALGMFGHTFSVACAADLDLIDEHRSESYGPMEINLRSVIHRLRSLARFATG